LVRRPPVEVLLVERVVALEDRIALLHRLRATAAVRIRPRRLRRVHVVLDVLDVLPALEQQGAESALGQLLGGPTAGDAGADDDGIVFGRLHVANMAPAGRCATSALPAAPGSSPPPPDGAAPSPLPSSSSPALRPRPCSSSGTSSCRRRSSPLRGCGAPS